MTSTNPLDGPRTLLERVRRIAAIGLTFLLLIFFVVSLILSHRGPTAPAESTAPTVTGEISMIWAGKICVRVSGVSDVCGFLAREPGIDLPTVGQRITVEVTGVPARDSSGAVVETVKFLIMTRPGLAT